MKNLKPLAAEIHQNAVLHGWWDEERSYAEITALFHSELSEALEEYRNGKPMVYGATAGACFDCASEECDCEDLRDTEICDHFKPEGIAVELADCAIRIMDYFGKTDVDMDEAQIVPEDDNNGCSLPELVAECHALISYSYEMGPFEARSAERASTLAEVIARMESWCAERDCDLSEVIRLKNAYNVSRPYRHGGKVV